MGTSRGLNILPRFLLRVHGVIQAGELQEPLHLHSVLVPLLVPLSGDQQWDVVLRVGPRGVGPVVGGGPRHEEAMVYLLRPGEIVLSSLPGGLQQLVPGQKPAHRELVKHAINIELSLELAQLPGKGRTQLLQKVPLLINARGGLTSPV